MKYAILGMIGMVSQVQSVGIHVTHPASLKAQVAVGKNGLIEAAFGLQGHVDYGEGFEARLFYPSSNTDGCREFQGPDFRTDPFHAQNENAAPERHPVVLMDEGGCSHAVKSANAESYGFRASFISAEHREFIKIKVGTSGGLPDGVKEMELVQNRTIPEFTILSTSAEHLVRYLQQKDAKQVHLKIDLSIPHPDNKVEVALWYSSLLDVPDSFLAGMRAYHRIFQGKIEYTPRISTYSCEECSEEIKRRDCVSDGKYCAFLPQHDSFPDDTSGPKFTELKLEGRKLVLEALAQKCSWEQSREQEPDLHSWFLNLHLVRAKLVTGYDMSSIYSAFLAFTPESIKTCVDYSFTRKGEYDSDNKILAQDRQDQFSARVHAHPALTINQQVYKGDLTPVDVAHAICAGFKDRPRDCRHEAIKKFLVNESDWGIPDYGQGVHEMVMMIGLVVVGVNILLLGFCKWRQSSGDDRAVVEMEVNQQVQNYFALRGEEQRSSTELQQ